MYSDHLHQVEDRSEAADDEELRQRGQTPTTAITLPDPIVSLRGALALPRTF